jgi:F420H(2)-dependent quinone reductase
MATMEGEYVPSTQAWVRDQVAEYEASGGARANTLRDTGIPIVVVTMRGARSGNLRKIGLMRVEHAGEYALVASRGGAPEHPAWYHNLLANPDEVLVQDGPEAVAMSVREVDGAERDTWWARAAEVFPTYLEYQAKTDRRIPVLMASPRGRSRS